MIPLLTSLCLPPPGGEDPDHRRGPAARDASGADCADPGWDDQRKDREGDPAGAAQKRGGRQGARREEGAAAGACVSALPDFETLLLFVSFVKAGQEAGSAKQRLTKGRLQACARRNGSGQRIAFLWQRDSAKSRRGAKGLLEEVGLFQVR
jgi:hypothetical protein